MTSPSHARPEPTVPTCSSGLDDAAEAARQLMARLETRGLRASGPWEQTESQLAVSAQCVDVEPYIGRTVWLLTPPGVEPAELFWHWERPRRNKLGYPVGRWFQPFCPAAATERAAAAIHRVVLADIARRARALTAVEGTNTLAPAVHLTPKDDHNAQIR
ncbi:hypothetical protein [Actinomadura violacea]|uniref:Uncharacterized protein n=1 Tax=Actinomadura violacea TaxID=2819934 RepID=A0ABS3S5Z7_9ACTN|nr:hypothetical protein [Actinomadura violacea]MBO2464003.1 hypothetical protein [Actinomadura violacea]